MPRPLILLCFIIALCTASCQKELSVERNSTVNTVNFSDDTSKIISIIQYDYSGGAATDSFLTVYRNHTLGGIKKIIGTISDYGASNDTLTEQYTYNSSNQLQQIDYIDPQQPVNNETYHISWSGNDVSQITQDSVGFIISRYQYQYTVSGANTMISYIQTPNTHNYTTTGTGGGLDYSYTINALLTVNSNFLPQYVTYFEHSYISNNGSSGHPANQWDTTRADMVFSGGDLAMVNAYRNATDTGDTFNPPPGSPNIDYFRDTTISTYTRSGNDNLAFTNFLTGLYGTRLFTLSVFFESALPFYEIPETFNDFTFNSRTLLGEVTLYKSSQNGIPDAPYSLTDAIMQNTFDSQNRLVFAKSIDLSTGLPKQGMKVIY